MLQLLKRLLVVLGILIVSLVLMSYLILRPSYDEVARTTSQNGKYDAVIFESNGDATTSFSYNVYITEKGEGIRFKSPVADLYGAVRSDQAYGVNLVWTDPDTLTIEYMSAKDATLNYGYATIDGDSVYVKLESGINDPNAPAGGMLYSKELTKQWRPIKNP